MSLIPDKEREHLRKIFQEGLRDEVKLVVFTQEFECEYCKETRQLMEELTALSDKIKLELYDFQKDAEKAKELGIDKIPAIALIGRRDYRIRFFGIPTGYEFSALIEDIVDVSQSTTRLSDRTRERLKALNRSIHIQVFVTPTCPYCPKAVRLAHQFAMENEFIKADTVEAVEFPHLAHKYNVMSVPKTVINETAEFVGAVPEDTFLENLLKTLASPQPPADTPTEP